MVGVGRGVTVALGVKEGVTEATWGSNVGDGVSSGGEGDGGAATRGAQAISPTMNSSRARNWQAPENINLIFRLNMTNLPRTHHVLIVELPL
jgi:hypothetical protein